MPVPTGYAAAPRATRCERLREQCPLFEIHSDSKRNEQHQAELESLAEKPAQKARPNHDQKHVRESQAAQRFESRQRFKTRRDGQNESGNCGQQDEWDHRSRYQFQISHLSAACPSSG